MRVIKIKERKMNYNNAKYKKPNVCFLRTFGCLIVYIQQLYG